MADDNADTTEHYADETSDYYEENFDLTWAEKAEVEMDGTTYVGESSEESVDLLSDDPQALEGEMFLTFTEEFRDHSHSGEVVLEVQNVNQTFETITFKKHPRYSRNRMMPEYNTDDTETVSFSYLEMVLGDEIHALEDDTPTIDVSFHICNKTHSFTDVSEYTTNQRGSGEWTVKIDGERVYKGEFAPTHVTVEPHTEE